MTPVARRAVLSGMGGVAFAAAASGILMGEQAEAMIPLGDAPDWPNLGRYRDANVRDRELPAAKRRCVFIGDSITDAWAVPQVGGGFFEKSGFLGRGISGQTTPQMVVRFHPDVVALKPTCVHILAGINDIAENTGPYRFEDTAGHLSAMTLMARGAGIKVVLAKVLPAASFPWRPALGSPTPKIAQLNAWIEAHAKEHGHAVVDYGPALTDGKDGLRADLAGDPVHPNAAGYAAMAPVALAAIEAVLK